MIKKNFILILLTLIIALGCQKETKTKQNKSISSFGASEALSSYFNFKKNLNNTTYSTSPISISSLKTNEKKDIPFEIIQENPYESKTKEYSFFEFEIKFKYEIGLLPESGTLEENQKTIKSTLNKILIKKNNKSGIIDYELISYIPSKSYLANSSSVLSNYYNQLNSNFDGFILHKNIGGEVILLERVNNGKIIEKLYHKKRNSFLKVSNISSLSYTECPEICYPATYYNPACNCYVTESECFIECPPSQYPGVSLDNGILSFESNQAFDEMLNQLDTEYEEHNASFFDSRDNMSDNAINDYADQIGFDEFKPLRDFENYFGFSSLRQSVELQMSNWMDNLEADGCSSPAGNASIDDETEQTLFNTSNQVKIAGVTYTLNSVSSSGCPVNDLCTPTTLNSCVLQHKTINEKAFGDNGLIWEKLKLDGRGLPIAGDGSQFMFRPKVKAKIIFYKIKNNGGRRRFATKLSVRIYGNIYNTQDGGAPGPNCIFREYLDTGHNPQRRRYRRKNKKTWGIYTQSKFCELTAEYKIQSSTVSLSLQP